MSRCLLSRFSIYSLMGRYEKIFALYKYLQALIIAKYQGNDYTTDAINDAALQG